MQKLIRLVDDLRSGIPPLPAQALIHQVREYLQTQILKIIYCLKDGHGLSFMGGTCLRICYGLKRYSEDLDFALDRKIDKYSFPTLIRRIRGEMEKLGFTIETTVDCKQAVHKSFIKVLNLLYSLGLSHSRDHKLQIKLEIDTNPVPVTDEQLESYFVTRYDEVFPILKHKNATLFAGKILALLCRAYTKGRDYYDLVWFLTRKTEIDFKYLNDGIKQAVSGGRMLPHPQITNVAQAMQEVRAVVQKADPSVVMHDIGRFLEDPGEEEWIKNYKKLFDQLCPQ